MLEKPLNISTQRDTEIASYENWVSRRAPDNLSTNAGAPLIAFQAGVSSRKPLLPSWWRSPFPRLLLA